MRPDICELKEWACSDAHETFMEHQLEHWLQHVSLELAPPESAKRIPDPWREWLEARLGGPSPFIAAYWVRYKQEYKRALTRAVRKAQSMGSILDGLSADAYDDRYAQIIEAACKEIGPW
jgi:hypothetical protein